MNKEIVKWQWNIPNVLSMYRILTFPIILVLAVMQKETWFIWLFCINLLTDVLDGWIARTFNMKTKFGAFLDSAADFGTFILAITGIIIFKWDDFLPYLWSFGLFVLLFLLVYLVPVIRYGSPVGYHLFSWKIGGYIQGIFFFVLFAFGFIAPFYLFMITWGIIACLEHLTIQAITHGPIINAKGLYWVLKNRRLQKGK